MEFRRGRNTWRIQTQEMLRRDSSSRALVQGLTAGTRSPLRLRRIALIGLNFPLTLRLGRFWQITLLALTRRSRSWIRVICQGLRSVTTELLFIRRAGGANAFSWAKQACKLRGNFAPFAQGRDNRASASKSRYPPCLP